MRKLNNAIFACFLEPEYPEQLYIFEKELHIRKKQVVSRMLAVRQIPLKAVRSPSELKTQHEITLQLERLFDLLLDCAQLRRRVTDHTIFLVSASELKTICIVMSALFTAMIHLFASKTYACDLPKFETAINALEDTYQRTLQVTAREPLVFLLFIKSLKNLSEIFNFFFKNELSLRRLLKS